MSKTRGELLLEWTQRINEVESNGYEIRRYCLDRGLKEQCYYSGLRKMVKTQLGRREFFMLLEGIEPKALNSRFSLEKNL